MRHILRGRKERCRKKEQKELSMLGKIVDMSLEDFEKELKEQKVNIGTINNLILNLEGVYYELRTRKDAVLKMKFEGAVDTDTTKSALNGLYAEMIKVEQKITYLKQRRKELIDVDKPLN